MCEKADKHPKYVNKFSNVAESTASMGLRKKQKSLLVMIKTKRH